MTKHATLFLEPLKLKGNKTDKKRDQISESVEEAREFVKGIVMVT